MRFGQMQTTHNSRKTRRNSFNIFFLLEMATISQESSPSFSFSTSALLGSKTCLARRCQQILSRAGEREREKIERRNELKIALFARTRCRDVSQILFFVFSFYLSSVVFRFSRCTKAHSIVSANIMYRNALIERRYQTSSTTLSRAFVRLVETLHTKIERYQ